MYRLYRKMTIYLYIFVWIQNGYLVNMVLALDPNNSFVKRLWCIVLIYLNRMNGC